MSTVCIYHGGCDDGFASAWVVRSALSEVTFVPGVYQRDPPWGDLTGQDVVLVDFSYKRPVMERIARLAAGVLVLDHHETARDDLMPLLDAGVVDGVFDMTRAGSMITWDHYHPAARPPRLLEYIQDRDLWRKQLPDSDAVIMALRSYPQEFHVWDELMSRADVDELAAEGRPILRYYRTLVEEAKRRARTVKLDEGNRVLRVPVVNVPRYLASEVAGELATEYGAEFAAAFWQNSDTTWEFSLRSPGDFHVGRFATRFGGGGHKGAAGFKADHIPAPFSLDSPI